MTPLCNSFCGIFVLLALFCPLSRPITLTYPFRPSWRSVILSHPIGPFCDLVIWHNFLGPGRGPVMLSHPIWPPCRSNPWGDTMPSLIWEWEVGAPGLCGLIIFRIFKDIWGYCTFFKQGYLLFFGGYIDTLSYLRKTLCPIRSHDVVFSHRVLVNRRLGC